eukprot:353067-Chlamydomonas_euryale.AAC.6
MWHPGNVAPRQCGTPALSCPCPCSSPPAVVGSHSTPAGQAPQPGPSPSSHSDKRNGAPVRPPATELAQQAHHQCPCVSRCQR